MSCENEDMAKTLAGGGGLRNRLADIFGSNWITAKLCGHIGAIQAEQNKPSKDKTPTAFEHQVDAVGEIERHRLRKDFFDDDKGHHESFLNASYDVSQIKLDREKLQGKVDHAENQHDEDYEEYHRQAGRIKISPKSEKFLLVALTILETIVISITFQPLAQDPVTLLAMGLLPGLLIVLAAHLCGILLRGLTKGKTEQNEPCEEKASPPATGTSARAPACHRHGRGIKIGLVLALILGACCLSSELAGFALWPLSMR